LAYLDHHFLFFTESGPKSTQKYPSPERAFFLTRENVLKCSQTIPGLADPGTFFSQAQISAKRCQKVPRTPDKPSTFIK